MKLIYITNIRIPSEKAQSINLMKTCEAFERTGNEVILIVPRRVNHIKGDVFEYYKIKNKFKIVKIFSFDLIWLGFFERAWFYIQSFIFGFFACLYAKIKYQQKNTIFYSRDFPTLFFMTFFGLHPIVEVHDYRSRSPKFFIKYVLKKAKKILVNSS